VFGRVGWVAGGAPRLVVALMSGFGSDRSEESAFQDVELATLDWKVVPGCPPGPTFFSGRRFL